MELMVSLNGIKVGTLLKDKNGGLHFSYTEPWMERPGARPISLSLPITKQKYAGDVVYNFFDNLLPDNPNIRNKIQARFNLVSGKSFDFLQKQLKINMRFFGSTSFNCYSSAS